MVDVYDANESRRFGLQELLLVERHHTGSPDTRCKECESAHLLSAEGAMLEASRMKNGGENDFKIAKKIRNIDFSKDRRVVQQEVRAVRKEINALRGIKDCDKHCSLNQLDLLSGEKDDWNDGDEDNQDSEEESGGGVYLLIGGLIVGAFIWTMAKQTT